MNIERYLIVSKNQHKYGANVKLVNTLKGTVPANSIAIKLNLEIPNEIFEKPRLEANIKINKEDISKPVITAEVRDNIKQVLQTQLGIEMDINIIEPTEEE